MNFIKALCGLVIIFTGMYLFVYEPQIDKEEEEYCYWFYKCSMTNHSMSL